jgi:hypothetical protein
MLDGDDREHEALERALDFGVVIHRLRLEIYLVTREWTGVRESEKHWDFDRLRDLAHRYDISPQC